MSLISSPLSWQHTQWQRLIVSAQHNKLPHALLLTGSQGVGKFNFAKALCHSLLCDVGLSPTSNSACSQCKACALLRAGTHPDFHLVQVEEKAQSIKIDQIRALVAGLSKTPQIGKRHCVIVHPAEALNINAANALLKLLEEPPGESVLVLVSAHPNRLPATIRSRCQQINFATPGSQEALAWLNGRKLKQAEEYLRLAKGAPLRALELSQQDGITNHQHFEKLMVGVLSRRVSVSDAAKDFAGQNESETLNAMIDCLREITKNRIGKVDSAHLPKAIPSHLSAHGDLLALFGLYDKLLTTKSLLLSTANPNKALLWEECLLDWLAFDQSAKGATSQAVKAAN